MIRLISEIIHNFLIKKNERKKNSNHLAEGFCYYTIDNNRNTFRSIPIEWQFLFTGFYVGEIVNQKSLDTRKHINIFTWFIQLLATFRFQFPLQFFFLTVARLHKHPIFETKINRNLLFTSHIVRSATSTGKPKKTVRAKK